MREVLDLAIATAREAGELLRGQFDRPRTGVSAKSSPSDVVTDADRAAEEVIIQRLTAARPDDEIVAEEGSSRAGSSGLRWLVDPLDGTTNFLFGIPHFCVSIACEDGDGVAAGVVFDPMRADLFTASRGDGATLNGKLLQVSSAADLASALIATGYSYVASERAAQARLTATMAPLVRDFRRNGSAALDLAWTAAGRFDGYFESALHRWDVAAGSLLVREAGGQVVAYAPSHTTEPGVIAATPLIFNALRELIHTSSTN